MDVTIVKYGDHLGRLFEILMVKSLVSSVRSLLRHMALHGRGVLIIHVEFIEM